MTTRGLLLCGGLALAVPGLVLAARQGQPQEPEGSKMPGVPAVGEPFPGGPRGPMEPGFPGGPPPFPGGMPPQGPGMFPGGPMPDPELLAEVRSDLEREFNARRRVDELSRRHREAQGSEKGAVKEELRKALGELLDVKVSMQEHRAKRLEEEVARNREMISKGKANREKIVDRRIEDLTSSAGWEW